MTRRIRLGLAGAFLHLAAPGPASAGMPSFTLADVKRVITYTLEDPTARRLESISFFLLGILLCTLVIQRIWNSLRKEFAWLPRLSYGKALGVMTLWGLLFVLVLTMISGARELMTPGAWEKTGLTYRVDDGAAAVEQQITTRHQAIERLRAALFADAEVNHKSFPTVESTRESSDPIWQVPLTSGARYVYVGGRMVDFESPEGSHEPRPLAYEPDAFGPDRLVVMTDGWIIWMPIGEIERALLPREVKK